VFGMRKSAGRTRAGHDPILPTPTFFLARRSFGISMDRFGLPNKARGGIQPQTEGTRGLWSRSSAPPRSPGSVARPDGEPPSRHMWTAPGLQRPLPCKRVRVVGRIACAHMSGFGALIGRCRAGFRDAHSKQGGDIDCRGVFRSVARLGSTDHTISSCSGKFRLWRVVVVTARQTASTGISFSSTPCS
jgi:hypothetical protein